MCVALENHPRLRAALRRVPPRRIGGVNHAAKPGANGAFARGLQRPRLLITPNVGLRGNVAGQKGENNRPRLNGRLCIGIVRNRAVVVVADPRECSFQFNPTGTASFTTSCDIAKSFLARNSVNYSNEAAPAGTPAQIKIGERSFFRYMMQPLIDSFHRAFREQ